jgi:hypothetical protein
MSINEAGLVLRQEAKNFINQVNFSKITPENICKLGKFENLIHELAKKSLSKEKQEDTPSLMEVKQLLIFNQSRDFFETQLILNTLYYAPPAMLCSYYDRPQVPFISSYENLSANPAIARLDRSALAFAPEDLKKAVGNLDDKKVDFFYVVSDARYAAQKSNGVLNLVTHCWAYPDLQKNEKERKSDVEMGLFPIFGVDYAHKDKAALAFNELKPMEVYAHYIGTSTMYSPNNAHFRIDPKIPVQVFWIAAKQNDRVLITKFVMITNSNEALGEEMCNSYRYCPNLSEHLDRLNRGTDVALKQVKVVSSLFKEGSEAKARQEFAELPQFIQNLAYKHIYFIHQAPKNVPFDFGRLSILDPSKLDPKYASNPQQISEALNKSFDELKEIYVTSQKQLFSKLNLVKDVKEEQIAALAEQFRENSPEAMAFFDNMLENDEKEAVFNAIWQLNGSIKGDMHFGSKRFFEKASNEERAQAILLATRRY